MEPKAGQSGAVQAGWFRRRPPRSRHAGAGFTLVELLVVMGILALLVGILLPVMDTVRDKSHEAGCLANLRQIGVAIEGYRQNHNRLLPRVAPLPSGDPFSEPDGLCGALKHFIDPTSDTWVCPADHRHVRGRVSASYFYVAGAFMLFLPPDPFPAARQVTEYFEKQAANSIPIVWDSEDRHPIGTALPRNGLYIDGRTERVGEPFTIPEG